MMRILTILTLLAALKSYLNVIYIVICKETDSRGEGSGASAGQSPHPAAATVRPPEVPQRISGVGSTVCPQLLPVCIAEPPTLGRGQGVKPIHPQSVRIMCYPWQDRKLQSGQHEDSRTSSDP